MLTSFHYQAKSLLSCLGVGAFLVIGTAAAQRDSFSYDEADTTKDLEERNAAHTAATAKRATQKEKLDIPDMVGRKRVHLIFPSQFDVIPQKIYDPDSIDMFVSIGETDPIAIASDLLRSTANSWYRMPTATHNPALRIYHTNTAGKGMGTPMLQNGLAPADSGAAGKTTPKDKKKAKTAGAAK